MLFIVICVYSNRSISSWSHIILCHSYCWILWLILRICSNLSFCSSYTHTCTCTMIYAILQLITLLTLFRKGRFIHGIRLFYLNVRFLYVKEDRFSCWLQQIRLPSYCFHNHHCIWTAHCFFTLHCSTTHWWVGWMSWISGVYITRFSTCCWWIVFLFKTSKLILFISCWPRE